MIFFSKKYYINVQKIYSLKNHLKKVIVYKDDLLDRFFYIHFLSDVYENNSVLSTNNRIKNLFLVTIS
jgi:hypothetical protein